jgi:hypothetical protein
VVHVFIAVKPTSTAFFALMCKNPVSMWIMGVPMSCWENTVAVTLNHVQLVAYHVMQSGIVGLFAPKKGKSTFHLLRWIPNFERSS